MRKKRRPYLRFRATLKLYYPLRPAVPLRQEPETLRLPTFLSSSALNFSSSSSSVRGPQNRLKKKVTLALAKACFSEASAQRGDSEHSEVLSRSLTWLTMASLSVV